MVGKWRHRKYLLLHMGLILHGLHKLNEASTSRYMIDTAPLSDRDGLRRISYERGALNMVFFTLFNQAHGVRIALYPLPSRFS